MTENQRTVERYLDGFRTSNHTLVLSCLTDDVEWVLPGGFHLAGKEAFDREIENDAFTGKPVITISRTTEANDVVIAEGDVRSSLKDGTPFHAVFCDVFEMQGGKIRKLISYVIPVA